MKSPLIAAMMAASALVAVPTLASADETTIIHHKTVVMPSQPAPQPAPVAETQTQTQTRTTAVRHVAVHRTSRRGAAHFHHIVRHAPPPHAMSATDAATQTSTTVRRETTQAPAPQPQVDQAPQVVEDRRTVIHRDDDGNVERHTRIIRQGADGMTSIERHSSEGATPDAP